uniref:NB-ARC domain-containing protein n=1 Tax=Leersia perrieri TaxID=77586 RepID=A0A0D9XAE8_9ORYZ
MCSSKVSPAFVVSTNDRRKLERHLLAVQCMLGDAEEKSKTNPAVKRWMKDLRAIAYEADDVLDDFHYEALRREAQISDSAIPKVPGYFTPHRPLLFLLTMSKKLNNVLKKINDLVEEMNKFGLVEGAEAAPMIHPHTHSGLHSLMEIVGRDDDKETVMNLLFEQQSNRKIAVLPIVGMGGLGKTTLAKMVYNDFSVQQHFKLPVWHCVSDNFNVNGIVRSIIELVTRVNCTLPDRIELLRSRLHEVVGRRRYLLVLDDVWNEELQKWEELSLQTLRLNECGNLQHLPEGMKFMSKLRHIYLIGCHSLKRMPPRIGQLKNLWTLTTFVVDTEDGYGLEELKDLQHLSGRLTTLASGIDMVVQGFNGSMEIFPNLKRMSLLHLPNLEKWTESEVTESIASVIFPELKELRIYNCPKLVNIPKAPILRELDINQCKIAANSLNHLTALSQLVYWGDWCVSTDVQFIPLSSWLSIETLDLGCLRNMVLPEEQQTIPPLESIRKLVIRYCNCFFSPNSSNWPFSFWDCFAFVEELTIVSCDDLVHWPVKEFRGLNSLRCVRFSYCNNLTGSSSEESFFLSGLEKLYVEFCNNLQEIPKLPASLEILVIKKCNSLVSLSLNLASLAKLQELQLFCCASLKNLPDSMDGFSALQDLCVQLCPGVETLPQSLLHRLPTLRKLITLGSHKLDRRCRRGGEYWEFVSKIPCLNGDFIEDRSNNGFAKIVMPCCSTLN